MKLYYFYNGIEEIVNNANNTTITNTYRKDKFIYQHIEVDHLFFVPEKESNSDGWCDAHRYGYDSKTGKCYDLGMTDVMPKIDYTGFVFDFIPNGIHIAKRDGTTFNVNGYLYSDTEID